MKTKQIYLGHITPLLVGSLIYILFRSSSLKMFYWFKSLNLLNIITELRQLTLIYYNTLPGSVLFALPDGLWLFAYVSLILHVWNNSIDTKSIIWVLLVPYIAIISEFGQLFGIIPGTFDFLDIIMYILGTTLPFIVYNKSITNNLKQI